MIHSIAFYILTPVSSLSKAYFLPLSEEWVFNISTLVGMENPFIHQNLGGLVEKNVHYFEMNFRRMTSLQNIEF